MADKEQAKMTPQPQSRGLQFQASTRPAQGRKNGERDGGTIPWCRLIPQQGKKYAPWVLIRYDYTDLGFRPLPANTPFWISPDIWVESSDPYGHPVAGQPNFVHATVFNLGRAPAYPTRVQFYWGDPSIGLGAANMHLIGTEWVYIPQMHSMDVRCNTPWVPIMLNSGHECLIVNTSAPILDPIIDPFQAWLDRHVGQRNVMVINASAGKQLKFKLAVNNVLPMLARTQFAAGLRHVEVNREQARNVHKGRLEDALAGFGLGHMNTAQELQGRFAKDTDQARMAADVARVITETKRRDETAFIHPVETPTRCEEHVRIRLTDEVSKTGTITLAQAGRLFAATGVLTRETAVPHMAGEAVLHTVNLQPGERRTLEVELLVPPNAQRGEFIVVHLVQRMETIPIGGYTVVAEVV
jgi:hypothetical protein